MAKNRDWQERNPEKTREYKHNWYVADQLRKDPSYREYQLPKVLTPERSTDLAWAAGIVDGEGYVGISRRKHPNTTDYYPRLRVTMTHKSTVERLLGMFVNTQVRLYQDKRNTPRKLQYVWDLRSRVVKEVLKQLYPYLFTKKEQAKYILEFSERCGAKIMGKRLTVAEKNERVTFFSILKHLNKRAGV